MEEEIVSSPNYSFASQLFIALLIIVISAFFCFRYSKSNKSSKSNISKYKENSYILITFIEELERLFKRITDKYSIIGLDTEHYRGLKYKGDICLFQVSLEEKSETETTLNLNQTNANVNVYILDILEIKSDCIKKFGDTNKLVEALRSVFSNPGIMKIVHCIVNDAEWIYQDFGLLLENVYDTQLAYQYTAGGKIQIGLETLMNKYFDLNIERNEKKQFQLSNWSERPLSKSQLNYASKDVYYLFEIKRILDAEHLKQNLDFDKLRKTQFENLGSTITVKKFDKVRDNAIKFLINNSLQVGTVDFEEKKKLFMSIYEINEKLAMKEDFNPENFYSLKLIHKIVQRLPKSKIELEQLLKYNDDKISESLFNKYTEVNNKVFNLIQETVNAIAIDMCTPSSLLIDKLNKSKPILEQPDKVKDKVKRKYVNMKKYVSKKPLYENCCMLAPNNEKLCYCDKKKMKWYISRGLAEQISEDPIVFKLKFEPEGRGYSDLQGMPSENYLKNRENCCVVCGKKEDYLRFHVVPIIYRQHFPLELKSHKSHDVLAFCISCHTEGNRIYEIKKKYFSDKLNVPLNIKDEAEDVFQDLKILLKKCKSLLKFYSGLPRDRLVSMSKEVIQDLNNKDFREKFKEFYFFVFPDGFSILKDEVLSVHFLKKVTEYSIPKSTEKNLHGKLIVEKLTDLKDFIREWRNFFIEKLNPKFLPDAWEKDLEYYKTHKDYK